VIKLCQCHFALKFHTGYPRDEYDLPWRYEVAVCFSYGIAVQNLSCTNFLERFLVRARARVCGGGIKVKVR
jgi:hypothetical protein